MIHDDGTVFTSTLIMVHAASVLISLLAIWWLARRQHTVPVRNARPLSEMTIIQNGTISTDERGHLVLEGWHVEGGTIDDLESHAVTTIIDTVKSMKRSPRYAGYVKRQLGCWF